MGDAGGSRLGQVVGPAGWSLVALLLFASGAATSSGLRLLAPKDDSSCAVPLDRASEKLRLEGCDLIRADLRHADLRDADLRGADLTGADLRGLDLRNADLRGAVLRGTHLDRACLLGAHLDRADLTETFLQDADTTAWTTAGAVGNTVPPVPTASIDPHRACGT